MFRWPPKPEYDDFEQRFHQKDMERKHKALEEDLSPMPYQVYKRNACIEAYSDYQEFGFPYVGGSYEQPHNWKRQMRLILKAKKDAEWDIASAEAQNQVPDPEED